ncbi:MAG: glycosyltransferase family 39 protein, partial [Planctomycetaceae bacterium]|nr:glycosyltransferase family 39 protein [Planctomycetaceae bacterium]
MNIFKHKLFGNNGLKIFQKFRLNAGPTQVMKSEGIFVVTIVLVIHISLLVYSDFVHSPTNGEIPALPSGIYHLTTGEFDLFRVNPPLVRSVSAIPILFMSPSTDWSNCHDVILSRDEFPVGAEFVRMNGKRSFFFFSIARLMCIAFSILGAFVCFSWARELYGEKSGLVALLLWCFSPTILGHGSTICADLPSAACGILACYQFWNWLRSPSWSQALFAGFALGLAELTKTTWIILFGLLPSLFLIYFLQTKITRPYKQLIVIILVGIFCINLGYGFERFGMPLGNFRFISHSLGGRYFDDNKKIIGGNRFKNTIIGHCPVPLPANYVAGIDTQKSDFEFRSDNYLCGTWKYGGWWYYYLFSFLVKEPIGMLILFFIATVITFRQCPVKWKDETILLLPALCVFILASSQTGMNHHYRYILPIFPFLFVWLAKVGECHFKTAIILLSYFAFSSISTYPHSLSYFNEFVGGAKNGPKYLLGSNVDWGQDVLLLKKWYDEHTESRPFYLECASYFDPVVAGIGYQKINPNDMRPGWYAVSVNCLYNREG